MSFSFKYFKVLYLFIKGWWLTIFFFVFYYMSFSFKYYGVLYLFIKGWGLTVFFLVFCFKCIILSFFLLKQSKLLTKNNYISFF